MVELDAFGRHTEARSEPPLEADRNVAQPDRSVTLVEKRLGHDPDRVREVDEPMTGCCPTSRPLGQIEDHRYGPERLREAAGACRFLADRAEAERQRLVDEAGRLATDAQLHDDKV